jgi:hypothetical protein
MFIAALIVLTNSFFNVYENAENDSIAQIAVLLHQHFAEADPLAARYLQILKSFLKTIADNRSSNVSSTHDFGRHDPIENLFSAKPNMVADIAQDPQGTSVPNYMPSQVPMWNWTPNMSSTDAMPDIAVPDLNMNDFGDSVEGLIYPGTAELLGPDPGPILEEVIHFDTLWPLNQDTGLYPGNIPMYGTSSNFL